MKQKNIYILLFAVSTLVYISCSNNEKDFFDSPEQVQAQVSLEDSTCVSEPFQELANKIDELNEQYEEECLKARGWRDFWSRVKQWTCVVLSDAIGFGIGYGGASTFGANPIVGAVGGVAVGASFSYAIYNYAVKGNADIQVFARRTSPEQSAGSPFKDGSISLNFDVLAPDSIGDEIDSVGYMHNMVLRSLYSDSTMHYQPDSIPKYITRAMVRTEILDCYSMHVQNYIEYKMDNIEYVDSIISDSISFHDYCTEMANLFPTEREFILVLERVCVGLERLDIIGKRKSYIGDIMNYVDNSSLTTNQKKKVKGCIQTAYASSLLWEEEQMAE